MKFKEMIDTLINGYTVAIRDEENENVCVTRTDSKGINPYLENEVVKWFPSGTMLNQSDFTVQLKGV